MRFLSQLPALLCVVCALLLVPSLQASIWSAPGALSPLQSVPAAPSSPVPQSPSFFRSLRDHLIEFVWQKPASAVSKQQRQTTNAPSTAPDQLLKRYGSEIVLRFDIRNEEERTALSEAADTLFLDVWEFTRDWADIRLSKDMVDPLYGLLPPSMQSKPLIHNLAQAIFESQSTAPEGSCEALSCPSPGVKLFDASHGSSPSPRSNPFFEKYQPLSVIVPWMRLMSSMFTTHVRMFNIGTSFEGRPIPAIRVGSHPHNAERFESPRKTIVSVGGMHAREWISTAAINYAAYELITAYGKSREITKLIEEFDFVFIPTLNPDGYAYTWDSDRLWRKNRQTTHLSFCPGIDLDRTWGFKWNGENTKGNPCSESYAGESEFEAQEAVEFANWLRNETENNNAEMVGFLDFHSYSQQILYPYSFSCDATPPTYEYLQELAIGLQKTIRLTNHKLYTVAAACDGSGYAHPMGVTSGGSALDWAYSQSVKYSYQIKLPDTGSYGFLLPSREIGPTGMEIYNSLVYLSQFLLSSPKVEKHDESPSTNEPVLRPGFDWAQKAQSKADEAFDKFVSDELEEEEEPTFELRKRR